MFIVVDIICISLLHISAGKRHNVSGPEFDAAPDSDFRQKVFLQKPLTIPSFQIIPILLR